MGFEWRIFFPISKEVFNAASTKHEPALHLSSQTDYLKHVHNSKLTTNLSGCEQRIDQYYVLRNINLGLKVRCALDSLPKSTTALVPDSLLELKVRSDKDKTLGNIYVCVIHLPSVQEMEQSDCQNRHAKNCNVLKLMKYHLAFGRTYSS